MGAKLRGTVPCEPWKPLQLACTFPHSHAVSLYPRPQVWGMKSPGKPAINGPREPEEKCSRSNAAGGPATAVGGFCMPPHCPLSWNQLPTNCLQQSPCRRLCSNANLAKKRQQRRGHHSSEGTAQQILSRFGLLVRNHWPLPSSEERGAEEEEVFREGLALWPKTTAFNDRIIRQTEWYIFWRLTCPFQSESWQARSNHAVVGPHAEFSDKRATKYSFSWAVVQGWWNGSRNGACQFPSKWSTCP